MYLSVVRAERERERAGNEKDSTTRAVPKRTYRRIDRERSTRAGNFLPLYTSLGCVWRRSRIQGRRKGGRYERCRGKKDESDLAVNIRGTRRERGGDGAGLRNAARRGLGAIFRR